MSLLNLCCLNVEALVEEGPVDEELVLALVLLVDDEHVEREVVEEVLVLLLVVLDDEVEVDESMRSESMRCLWTRDLCWSFLSTYWR